MHGGHAFVVDRLGGQILVYDLSEPLSPRLVTSFAPATGHPRELLVIPGYDLVRPAKTPCDPSAGERHLSLDVPAVRAGCLARARTLLVVIGGAVNPTLGGEVFGAGSGQYLAVFDATEVRRIRPVASSAVSFDPTAVLGKLRWSPPHLTYVEHGGHASVNAVDLQLYVFGLSLDAVDLDAMPAGGDRGHDANGDGDYGDVDERLPLPPRPLAGRVGLGFVGREVVASAWDTTQSILDYAYSAPTRFVGAALGRGRTSTAAVGPAYRTLAWRELSAPALPRSRTSVGLPGGFEARVLASWT